MPMLARRPKEADGFLSPERAALAQAIADLREIDARAAAAANATGWNGTATTRRADATAARDAAMAGLKEAQAAQARHFADEAMGVTSTLTVSVREARQRLEDAEAELSAVTDAIKALEPIQQQAEYDRGYAERRVAAAVQAVVAAEGGAYATAAGARLQRLQRELVQAGWLVDALIRTGAMPVGTEPGAAYGKPADSGTRYAVYRLQTAPAEWGRIGVGALDAPRDQTDAWNAAVKALQRDATASLPTGEK